MNIRPYVVAVILTASWTSSALGQTTIPGNSLALRSSGANSSGSWALHDNGYVGTYITLAEPGPVTITVEASGQTDAGIAPRMTIAVGDSSQSFDVDAGMSPYQHTFSLPAGTHFVRTDFSNDRAKSPTRSLTVGSLKIDGATVSNANTSALALASANSYIENFRKGEGQLQLVGIEPGAAVQVRLVNHAFNFGTAAANPTFTNNYWSTNPAPGSTVAKYQEFIRTHFNMLAPENAGKWGSNEQTRDVVNMSVNDAIVAFANANGMRFRQHNLLWGSTGNNPGWVNTLLQQALTSPTAKAELLAEINERIAYYVGDGVGAERARDYYELDVLNEGMHENEFRTIFGDDGLAAIFNSVATAATAAGVEPKLFVNEYNVLQFSDNPAVGGFQPDNYANWFREHGERIEAAGGQVDGYGVQYYALLDANGNDNSPHSAARMQQVFQNLSLTGDVFALTEWGVQNSGSPSASAVADVLEDTMRMTFGSANATGFNMWGFWPGAMWNQATFGALVDLNFNLTQAGVRYEQLMSEWSTDLTLQADADGAVGFRGFYGDYEITVDGRAYNLSLVKGQGEYSLVVGLASDFNGDDVVDPSDLEVWRAGFGVDDRGDADGDMDTDGLDLFIWQRELGLERSPSSPAASAAAVPEPGGALMALAGLMSRVFSRKSANLGAR